MVETTRDAVALLRHLRRIDGAGAASPDPAVVALLARLQTRPDAWLNWLEHQELAGYCGALLADTGLDEALLPAARERLTHARRRQSRRNRRLLELLRALKAGLEEAGVPFLLIKGFVVSVRFAGGLDRRLMWDQDVIVRPRDLGAVMAAGETLGLRARAGAGLDPARLTRVLHAIELLDAKRKLDIHWVFRNRRGMRLGYDDLAPAAQPLELGGTPVQAISDLDLLVVSALSLLNDMERSSVRLRKVWDVYLMVTQLDADTDWAGWLQRPDVRPLRRPLLNVIAFALALVADGDDCLRLRARLAEHRHLLRIAEPETARRIARRPRQSLVNRWLMSRVQPVPAAQWWAWWLGTLPVRVWHGRKL
ncbi:nucleotidyltransferase family protein [uncultured Thiohalocapsa sp.]|uniref:nucleotidyltransferase family protein n=1 Tax=uncultured Thiohalocapsa sp. TaxID=768990 RepID=UPI0025FA1648|nr:nucleotidyltransferase family protein [uncultured Thiohalocapsa sp.]